MVDRYGEFNMATVTGAPMESGKVAGRASNRRATVRIETEMGCHSNIRIVHESTQRGIMKTTRHWMEQGVKGRRVRYALHGESFDVLRREEAELDAINGRGDRLGGVHDCRLPASRGYTSLG